MHIKIVHFVVALLLFEISTSDPIKNDSKILKEIIEDIRFQFNKVKASVDIVISYTKPPRGRVGPPIESNEECTITKDELEELQSIINDALNNSTNSDPNVYCDFDGGSADQNCDDLMKMIQCGILHLEQGVFNSSSSLAESMKWKNAYDTLVKQVDKLLSDLEQSLTQEYQEKLDDMITEMQSLRAKIQRLTEALQNSAKPMISRIHRWETDEAWEEYSHINDEVFLRNLIAAAYYDRTYEKDLTMICTNVLWFLQNSPKLEYIAIGINEFVKVVRDSGENPVLFSYANAVFFYSKDMKPEGVSTSDLQQLAEDFKNFLIPPGSKVILGPEDFVSGLVYDAVVDLEKNYHGAKVTEMMEGLVRFTYSGELKNCLNITNFLNKRASKDYYGRGATTLVLEVVKNGQSDHLDFIPVAYQMICKMRKIGQIDSINNAFPLSIQQQRESLESLAAADEKCK